MKRARFEHLLERTMGLKAASIGTSAVDRAVDTRIRSCKLESDDAYWDLLQRSREELQELIETIIVPETWFFRDPEAFKAMVRIVTTQWLKEGASRQLRLLSLPCSTGEEPYTMAMALLDAGMPANCFRIDAIDISARSLTHARSGVYGRNSFRGQDLAFRDRHFEPVERGHRLRDAARSPVQFAQGNVIDADFLSGAESYDVIFCRNLLIYFDVPTQNRAIAVLKRLLATQGVLFVGHSEVGLMAANGLGSARIPMAFAFHKEAAQPRPAEVPPIPAAALPKRKAVSTRPVSSKPAHPRPFTREAAPVAPSSQTLDELRRIADDGRLQEAARKCEAHMRECGPSPDALLLLGLISDASGDLSAAANYYRKALYLEPGNADALGHLALLLKKQGDHAAARLLDDRMRRQDGRRAQ